MDILEIKDIAESLKRRLELLMSAGMTSIPKARGVRKAAQGAAPSDWAVFSGSLAEASSHSPCGHGDWKGVLFGVWPLGKAAVIWGVPMAGPSLSDNPFGAEPLAQLEKMLNWLAEQVKADKPRVSNPRAVLAARCPQAASYSDTEASEACRGNLQEETRGAKGLFLMGELAAWALLQTADLGEGRGRVYDDKGRSAVVSFSPEELVKDQELKKGAHADLKRLIGALGA